MFPALGVDCMLPALEIGCIFPACTWRRFTFSPPLASIYTFPAIGIGCIFLHLASNSLVPALGIGLNISALAIGLGSEIRETQTLNLPLNMSKFVA